MMVDMGDTTSILGVFFLKNIYSKTLYKFLIFLKCLITTLIFQRYFLILKILRFLRLKAYYSIVDITLCSVMQKSMLWLLFSARHKPEKISLATRKLKNKDGKIWKLWKFSFFFIVGTWC